MKAGAGGRGDGVTSQGNQLAQKIETKLSVRNIFDWKLHTFCTVS
jgi:hypothetical protein